MKQAIKHQVIILILQACCSYTLNVQLLTGWRQKNTEKHTQTNSVVYAVYMWPWTPNISLINTLLGFPDGSSDKEPTYQWRRPKRCKCNPWVRKIPWRRAWQPTPVFLPGESHGWRSLAGYSPQDRKELDMAEVTACTNNNLPSHPHYIFSFDLLKLVLFLPQFMYMSRL